MQPESLPASAQQQQQPPPPQQQQQQQQPQPQQQQQQQQQEEEEEVVVVAAEPQPEPQQQPIAAAELEAAPQAAERQLSKPQRGARGGRRARPSPAAAARPAASPDLFGGLPDDPFAGLQPAVQNSSNHSWSARSSRRRTRSPRDGAAPTTSAAAAGPSLGALPSIFLYGSSSSSSSSSSSGNGGGSSSSTRTHQPTATGRIQGVSSARQPKLQLKSVQRAVARTDHRTWDGSDDSSDSGDEMLAELGIESHKTLLKSRQKRTVSYIVMVTEKPSPPPAWAVEWKAAGHGGLLPRSKLQMAQQRLAFAMLLAAQDRKGASLSLGLIPDLVQAVSNEAPQWRPAPVRGMLRRAGDQRSRPRKQEVMVVAMEQEEKHRLQTTRSATQNAGYPSAVVPPNSLAEAPAASVAEGVPPSEAAPLSEGVPPMQT